MDYLAIGQNILAVVGAAVILLVSWAVIEDIYDDRKRGSYDWEPEVDRDDFRRLETELRQSMKREIAHNDRGFRVPSWEPTLKGRVDEIEKYLKLNIAVHPAQEPKLVTKQVTKKEK